MSTRAPGGEDSDRATLDAAATTSRDDQGELDALRRRVAELEACEAELRAADERSRLESIAHRERVKELNCVYAISRLRERPEVTEAEVLQGIVDLVPSAWQFPAIACARISLQDRDYVTVEFRESPWRLATPISVQSEVVGELAVYYLEERPPLFEGPFLREERALLDTIAERVSKFLEHRQIEERARQQQQQLIHLDKMAALGTLVSGIAHEINNPTNFIMLNTPVLRDVFESVLPILDRYAEENGDFTAGGLPYSEMREAIGPLFSGVLEGSQRIKSIVESLKDFARTGSPDLSQGIDVNGVVRSALVLLGNRVRTSTRRFTVEYAPSLPLVRGNFQRLEQVVVNLVQNACDALPDRDHAIDVTTSHDAHADAIVVAVRDEGVGMAPEVVPRVTDPFFTTKRHRGGTGLGLSVSAGIVKDHGGELRFVSSPGRGTTAMLVLPAAARNGGERR